MTHHDKIPDLLNNLVLTPAISTAARAVGISREVVYSWLIASRRGDPKLNAIEWHGVVQPFHIHFDNSKKLAIVNIESLALDRAMNGSTYPSEFRGAPVFLEDERIVHEFGDKEFDPALCELLFGQSDKWLRNPETGERVRAQTHQKPSENLVALVLQSWMSKYAKHATLDVAHGGILRIDTNAPQGEVKMIESKPEEIVQIEEVDESERRGGFLAVPKPLTNTSEIDAMNKAGAFASQDVTFTKEDGTTTVVPGTPPPSPADDPRLQDQPTDSPQVRELKALARRGPINPRPRSAHAVLENRGKPSDEPPPPPEPQQPEQKADQAGYGAGKVLPHGVRIV